MAGKKLGNIYVELGLDSKEFTKGEAKILQSAQSTSLLMEKNWRTLGGHSDQIFNAMKTNITNAYDAIANKSTSTNAEIVRAQQAAADKIKSINEQQYGHHNTLLQTLRANWIAASVAIAAAMVVMNKAWNLAKIGAEFEEQKGILDNLSKKYSTTATSIVDSMRKASQGLVADLDLMQIALGGVGKGMSPDQMIKLAGAAEILGDVVGQNTTEALKSLSEALESGRAKALKGYAGTTIDLTAAFGDLAGKMTAAEKAQAMYALIMIHATKLQNEQTSAVSTAADKIELMEAKYKNAMLTIQTYSKTALVWIYDVIKNMSLIPAKTATTGPGVYTVPEPGAETKADPIKEYEKQIVALKKLLQARKDDTDAVKNAAKDRREAEKAVEAATKAATEATRKATYEIESVGFSQYQKDLDRIKAEAEKYREAGVSKVVVAQYVAAETELALRKSFIVQTEESKKMYDAQVKASEEYRKMIADEQAFSVDKHTAAMLKIVANENNKLLAAEKLMDEGRISFDEYQAYLVLVSQNTALAIADLLQQELKDKADFYSEISGYEDEYHKKQFAWIDEEGKRRGKAINDEIAGAKWAADQKEKFTRQEMENVGKKWDYDNKYVNDTIANTGTMIDAMMTMYDKDSSEYKRLADAKKIIQIAELAMTVAKNAQIIAANLGLITSNTAVTMSNAGAAVTGASIGVGPTGFATAAAMIALLAGVFAMYGIAAGGGGASVSAPALPKSTVLGAADGTASESIANSMKLMEDTYTMEDTKLTAIYNALKDLNSSIIGLVTNIVRTGGITTEGMNIDLSGTPNIPGWLQTSVDFSYNVLTLGGNKILEVLNAICNPIAGFVSLLPKLYKDLFGGEIERSIEAQGIEIGATVIKNLFAGIDISAQAYARVLEEHKGGLFSSGWDSHYTKPGDLDKKVITMLTLVFENIGTTLLEVAKGLGTDVQAVYDYVFEGVQINLKDMNAEEMSKALTDYFNSIADKAAETLFGNIILQYQKLNEALLETAVRLVNDKAIVEGVLKMTGQTFEGTIPQIIKFSESLIEMAGGLDKLTEAASTFFDKFYSDVEKQAYLQTQLSDTMTAMNLILPDTRDAYKALVSGLDLTTTSGKEAYVTLLKLSGAADTYYVYLEQVASKKADLEIQIMELTGDAAGALTAQRTIELAAMDASLRPLQERIYALQDEAAAVAASKNMAADAVASLKTEVDRITAITKSMQSLNIQILTLTGDTVGALAAQRQIELAALDESLRPLQQRIYALQDEAQAITDLTTAIDTLKNRAQQIAQFIIDMGMSAQAPVQSAAAWDTEYSRQRTLAMTSGATDQQISDYLAFAKQYLSYEQSYGTTGSYQAIYDAIMKDVTGLGTATNTALDIAQRQLDVLIQIRDEGGMKASYASGTDYVPETGLYQLHRGEIVSTKSDSIKKLGAAIGDYIINSNGGSNGGDIHVSVTIDGREIGNVVAKQFKTNGDLQKSAQKSIRNLN